MVGFHSLREGDQDSRVHCCLLNASALAVAFSAAPRSAP